MMEIKIRSFNGIGDALFCTPSLSVIKKRYEKEVEIVINTNFPLLFRDNPNVDKLGVDKTDGIFLGYPDPIHARLPTCHHIMSDWKIICAKYGLQTPPPELKPELYLTGMCPKNLRKNVGVQTLHKGHWGGKKVWPFFDRLVLQYNRCVALPKCRDVAALARVLSSFELVVCAEGGISHLAKALDVPAIVIYGGFAKPEWNGYPDQINVCNPLPCSYCYNSRDCENDSKKKCMTDITVEHVVSLIVKTLYGHNG